MNAWHATALPHQSKKRLSSKASCVTKPTRHLRVVLDTNVIISKLIAKEGVAAQTFDAVFAQCVVLATPETLTEVTTKFAHKKFARYATQAEHDDLLRALYERIELVETISTASASPDPNDNMFLALAVDGHADYIGKRR